MGTYSGRKKTYTCILDLSAPHDNEIRTSLNELINKEELSISYVTIDNVIKIIKQCGKGLKCVRSIFETCFN